MRKAAAAALGLQRQAKAGVILPLSGNPSGAEGIGEAWRHIVLGAADIAMCGESRPPSRRYLSPLIWRVPDTESTRI
jgi:3-oxoacyl-(acyl-carrier-protein) synthase